jgi:hypothetical protein
MATQIKTQQPWLMASALLGLPRLLQFMKDNVLTLEQAEIALRSEVELCVELQHTPIDKSPIKIPWAKIITKAFEPYGIKWQLDTGDGKEEVVLDEEVVQQQIHSRENKRRKKHSGSNNFRHLWTSLLDVGPDIGDKLGIALERKSGRTDVPRIRRGLENDSRIVLEVLEMLNRDPLKIRRKSAKISPAILLGRMSLEQEDRQTLLKTLWDELKKCREDEARAGQRAREIEAELEKLSGSKKITGKKK